MIRENALILHYRFQRYEVMCGPHSLGAFHRSATNLKTALSKFTFLPCQVLTWMLSLRWFLRSLYGICGTVGCQRLSKF